MTSVRVMRIRKRSLGDPLTSDSWERSEEVETSPQQSWCERRNPGRYLGVPEEQGGDPKVSGSEQVCKYLGVP